MAEMAAKKSDECAKLLKTATSEKGAATRLLEAAEKGRTACVEAMLEGGADVNAKDDDGWTALHFAAGDGTPELIKLLLSKGLKADAEDKDGATPLEMAEEEEHEEAAELLKASLE